MFSLRTLYVHGCKDTKLFRNRQRILEEKTPSRALTPLGIIPYSVSNSSNESSFGLGDGSLILLR